MARTLNPEAHAIRRDVFIDVAERMIQVKGYDKVSIQDLLDDLGASKGAFYHYFDSKADLLEAIVDRMVDVGVARFAPRIVASDHSAIEKFESFFGDLAQYKAEHKNLIFGFMRTWLSDDNTIVREHFRRGLVGRLEPLMATIVRQGVSEGIFHVTSPEATARVLVSLFQGMNEDATGLFLALEAGTVSLEQLEVRLAAYTEAFERILGARPGAIRFTNISVIRDWQHWSETYRKEHP